MDKKILVVGGAGYVGSHCVKQLVEGGHEVVVLDNLSYGHREAVSAEIPFLEGDLGDYELVSRLLKEQDIEVVMHFAAFAYVGESVEKPLKYYRNNVENTIRLLQAMSDCGVRKFIFSSTCATYGQPEEMPIHEGMSQSPINPYGQTKLDVEHLLKSLAHTGEMNSVVFRYFNASGAAQDGSIGEIHDPETHLIPLAIDAATGKRGELKVFGDDYPTPDGSCLRDYIHVDDLASAHIKALDKLSEYKGYFHYNLGTGKPTSVLEIIKTVEDVSGLKVPYSIAPRRAGDPAELYAKSSKAADELGWEPDYKEIKRIIETAWKWHESHPNGYKP